ncbi:MAG TPA: DUF5060 domain-containing protein [Opitutales bacterium]|nr:DUF5060 domain-containing protein [Opitutales bacterium]
MKYFWRWILMLALGLAGPSSRAANAGPATVEQWGVYELTLPGPASGNPFTDVDFSANFTQGGTTVKVDGFYDGDGVYRVRFMPDKTGDWQYTTASNVAELNGKTGAFAVTPTTGNNHGPVRVAHTYHFAYADGTPYRELGTTSYGWASAPDDMEEQTLKTLAAAPFNKIRMEVFPDTNSTGRFAPKLYPYLKTADGRWDYTRFDPAFFQHYEKRLGQLRDLDIQADVILFDPYGNNPGLNMGRANDDRYLRYVVARFGAYRNVWWSLANEWDLMRAKTEADFAHYGELVSADDPYHHLLSIHNSAVIFNNTLPWITHASIQNGSAVESSDRAELYRDVYRKPIVYDEVKYEGDATQRWGQLTPEEMVHRFWEGIVAGTYVGHGEIYQSPDGSWLANGGVLRGQSPSRLAFLKKILEDSPPQGLDPIDKWQDTPAAGVPGQYYLYYFGLHAPASWPFQLYKNGIKDGMRFKVEIIDTWNMTITPVDGEFVTKKKDNYNFVDEQGRTIALPDQPYIALRIRRVDNAPAAPLTAPNGE